MCKYIPIIMNRLEALENIASYQQKQTKSCSESKGNITAENLLLREEQLTQRYEICLAELDELKNVKQKLEEEIKFLDEFKSKRSEREPIPLSRIGKIKVLNEEIKATISQLN